MATGIIKRLVAERGFGFVAEEGREGELFFHASTVRRVAFEGLRVGQRVEFDSEPDPGGRGRRAINVRPAGELEQEGAHGSEDDDTQEYLVPGTFTVRYEGEQQMQEGVERLSQGAWRLRRVTRLPDGGVIAEFGVGDSPSTES